VNLGIRINRIPLELGAPVPREMLAAAAFRPNGLLHRLLRRQSFGQTTYDIADCDFEGLADSVHIYPCNHSYLDRDRRWDTRATLFLRHGRLERILFQVIDGQTAALNFLERFTSGVTALVGQPDEENLYSTCWQTRNTRIEARLHPDQLNVDFDIIIDDGVGCRRLH